MSDLDQKPSGSKDQAVLTELRDRYKHATEQWKEAKAERGTDMRYLQGDPWEEADRKGRKDTGRPCINHDELNQYVNSCVNNVRQNKRAIKIGPEGNGADEKTAEFQESLVRSIEKKSQAAFIYVQAFQGMVEGSYSFMRIGRKYISDDSFDQEITLRGIPNADSVLMDPDCKEPDWSDQEYCFVLDPLTRDEFKRRWPEAQVTDFTNDDMRVANDWITESKVLVAEYWRIERTHAKLYQLEDGASVSTLPKGQTPLKTRDVETKKVVQYMTNGVEILERNPQPGDQIPIIPFIGLERWVDDGNGAKRKLNSLVRLARDPQMSHAYLCSQEMEEAGLSPKTPYIGYKGQFESDFLAWSTVTKKPHAFLQVDAVVDGSNNQVLPLPQRVPFTPNFQAYEVAKDSCRRAIQAAMGISPLPTAAQRNNEKSGLALEKITASQELGSFHFLDNFDRALQYAGRVMLAWIKVTYDTEREMSLRKPDDSHNLATINTEQPYPDPKTGEPLQYDAQKGDHYPDISTAPSYHSQVEEAAAFLDTLIQNLKDLPLAPPQAQKLLALAIQMRQLGPKGDEMAKIISPDEQGQGMPPQAQQAIQQGQQHLQLMTQLAQKLQAEIQQLKLEKAGKVIDNQARMAIEKLKIEAGIAAAEIETKAQNASERNEFVSDAWKELHGAAHDAGMQADQNAADQALAAQQQQHQQSLSDQQGQQQQALAAQQQQAQQQEPEAA